MRLTKRSITHSAFGVRFLFILIPFVTLEACGEPLFIRIPCSLHALNGTSHYRSTNFRLVCHENTHYWNRSCFRSTQHDIGFEPNTSIYVIIHCNIYVTRTNIQCLLHNIFDPMCAICYYRDYASPLSYN